MIKNLIFATLGLLSLTVQGSAFDEGAFDENESQCWSNCLGFDSVLTFDIGGGYRQDKLKWNVYPNSTPNTVIRENWDDLNMGIVETNAQLLVCEHALFKFDFNYGWFDRAGYQKIKEYNFATKTLLEDLKSRARGRVYDVSGGVGYQFNWDCYRYSFAPLVGYSYYYQKLKNHKYHDELTSNVVYSHNNYKNRWRGPWVGFSAAYQPSCEMQLYFIYTYHWARFRGKIHENIASGISGDLKSNGVTGNQFTVGTTYEFCHNWLLGLKFDYKCFGHHKGEFITKMANETTTKSPLRRLRWESLYATIDVAYVF